MFHLTRFHHRDMFSKNWRQLGAVSPRIVRDLFFLPAAMPYANAVLFSVLQSFIIIFLAGNFLSRNRKCTSNEAFDVRPIANGEYIWGKGLGVVYLLTTLNMMVVLLVFVINLFGSVQPCSVWLYLFYFFTLTLPSLLFMTGCTILV